MYEPWKAFKMGLYAGLWLGLGFIIGRNDPGPWYVGAIFVAIVAVAQGVAFFLWETLFTVLTQGVASIVRSYQKRDPRN